MISFISLEQNQKFLHILRKIPVTQLNVSCTTYSSCCLVNFPFTKRSTLTLIERDIVNKEGVVIGKYTGVALGIIVCQYR